MSAPAPQRQHRCLAWRLGMLAVLSFAFGFALVPFYDAFCRTLGINGRPASATPTTSATAAPAIAASHSVRVGFTATAMPGLDWAIEAPTIDLEARPGEARRVNFRVHNLSRQALAGRAVPSVSPPQAAQYLQKIECFCFQMQRLGPGESRELPLRFVLRPDIDPTLSELTLAYAFYPARETP